MSAVVVGICCLKAFAKKEIHASSYIEGLLPDVINVWQLIVSLLSYVRVITEMESRGSSAKCKMAKGSKTCSSDIATMIVSRELSSKLFLAKMILS